MIGRRTFIKRAAAATALGSGLIGGARRCCGRSPAIRTSRSSSSCRLCRAGTSISSPRAVGERMSWTIRQQIAWRNRTRRRRRDQHGRRDEERSGRLHGADHPTTKNAAAAPHIANLPYDYTKELQPVCYLGRQLQYLAAHSSLGRQHRQGAGRLRQGQSGLGPASSGVGSNQHVAGEWLAKRGRHQARARALSRRRPGDQRPDRRAREDRVPRPDRSSVQHYKAGVIKLLAHTGSKRSPILPEIPTLEEAG